MSSFEYDITYELTIPIRNFQFGYVLTILIWPFRIGPNDVSMNYCPIIQI